MFRTLDDFVVEWHQESTATLELLRGLPDASLSQRVTDDGRSLGRLGWHITLTIVEMLSAAGLRLDVSNDHDQPLPRTASEIADRYETDAAMIEPALRLQWTDEMLLEEVPMYGERWKRGAVLSTLIRHQSHHRGQMTVLMRQAGLEVKGVYGPAREEWSALGMAAME